MDLRGAERVFLAMCEIWPDAPIYTAVYDERGTEGRFAHRDIRTSFLQRVRPTSRNFRTLLPLYPSAIESFDLSGFDLVVSSSSAWAHAVICGPETMHVCYCHNPFRYVWNDRTLTLDSRPEPISRSMLRALFRRWRQWDWIAAQRVDRYVCNSRATQARIRSYFGRDATVVHPPVETHRFRQGQVGDYYMVLSELMRHKRIDVAVRAFNQLRMPLVIVGDGPDAGRLRRLAGPNVRFAGRVDDEAVSRLLSGTRGLVVTASEEFGIAAVEAQAAGRPVIANRAGGLLENVIEGETGRFWSGGPDELAAAVLSFDDAAVDPAACVANAERFDVKVFREELPREVEAAFARGLEESRVERTRPRRTALQRRGLARRLG